eukprot:NODE_751_length_1376_cov_301.180924.p3 GENE.NODE_751_length_1376_cov_301.180924~~NODE_751_length_1376_cov_301.180924.p3  ORF type:complete len:227 (-),score=56.37 NODE_751_length_1376_cov_301.180924:97-777(-)
MRRTARAAGQPQPHPRRHQRAVAVAGRCGAQDGRGAARAFHLRRADGRRGKAPGDPHGLTADEIGAIRLYTADSQLYPEVNALLRNRNRMSLKPFFSYLRLMLTARAKLPKVAGAVWRGVAGVDLRTKYPGGKRLTWWAFSSTTKRLDTLLNPQFLGQTGIRTVFMVEIVSGVDIMRYSAFADEETEVLLFPGTMLEVVASMDMGAGLYQVHLREVVLPEGAALFQ